MRLAKAKEQNYAWSRPATISRSRQGGKGVRGFQWAAAQLRRGATRFDGQRGPRYILGRRMSTPAAHHGKPLRDDCIKPIQP